MPRFLRPNSVIRGLASSDLVTTRNGIYTPGGSAGLIVPQVIAWPFATDDAGVSFPSGIVGIRSVARARTTERAWATPGDPLENLDEWIAVPDTLPAGYTSRAARDANRGPTGTTTKGAPYLLIDLNGLGDSATQPNFDNSHSGEPFRMLANWTVNGLAPGTLTGFCPKYRPSGGGGVVPLSWVPMNVSKKVLPCWIRGGNLSEWRNGLPGAYSYIDPWFDITGKPLQLEPYGTAMWTPQTVGLRAVRVRATVIATAANWAATTPSDFKCQFLARRNADNSIGGWGDTSIYLSPTYTTTDFSLSPVVVGFGLSVYYMEKVIDLSGDLPGPSDGLRAWMVGYAAAGSLVNGPSDYSNAVIGDKAYTKRVDCSPTVMVPPWFSVYGAGIGAPGGI